MVVRGLRSILLFSTPDPLCSKAYGQPLESNPWLSCIALTYSISLRGINHGYACRAGRRRFLAFPAPDSMGEVADAAARQGSHTDNRRTHSPPAGSDTNRIHELPLLQSLDTYSVQCLLGPMTPTIQSAQISGKASVEIAGWLPAF